jgi:paired amphipathic helix protein Sin3a
MTFDVEGMSHDFLYSYYITSYQMIDPTEGVPNEIAWPILRRNRPRDAEGEKESSNDLPPHWNEGLQIRILPSSFRILYEVGTADGFVQSKKMRRRGLSGMNALQQERKTKFEQKFVTNPKWMEGLSADEIEQANRAHQRLVDGEETIVETTEQPMDTTGNETS